MRRSEPRRTSTRTCQCSRSNALATAAPTNPVAPVTSAFMRDGRRSARSERSARFDSAARAAQQGQRSRAAPTIKTADQTRQMRTRPRCARRDHRARQHIRRRVSTITRTAMKGRSCRAATCATAALSMSTAAAPVARKPRPLSARRLDRPGAGEQAPPAHRALARARLRPSAFAPARGRWQSGRRRREITSHGKTTLPAVERRVESAGHAEAHERRGAGFDQRARPRAPRRRSRCRSPPTAIRRRARRVARARIAAAPHRWAEMRAPPLRAPRRRPRVQDGPGLNERFRDASGRGTLPAPTTGNRPSSRGSAGKTPAGIPAR